MGDPRLKPLVLSEDERRKLENWVKRRSTAQGLTLRARIVLPARRAAATLRSRRGWASTTRRSADGGQVSCVSGWTDYQMTRVGSAAHYHRRPGGGGGGPHLGGGPRKGHALVEAGAGQVGRHLAFQRAADLAGLWAAALADRDPQDLSRPAADRQDPGRRWALPGPPANAVVFSVDEKPQIQALQRTAPVLPKIPGVPERRSFDYEGTAP
jgi:hypothetical protein